MADTGTPTPRRVRASYVPVVIEGRVAFDYDPYRKLVIWQYRGVRHVVDLALIEQREQQAQSESKPVDAE